MKKILLALALIMGFTNAADLKKQILEQNKEIVQLASVEISKSLPQTVDKYTTLTKVEGKETKLIYIFEINTGSKSDEAIKKEDKSRMKKVVTKGICQSSKRFLDSNIDITYLYLNATSKIKLFQFDVNKNSCLNK